MWERAAAGRVREPESGSSQPSHAPGLGGPKEVGQQGGQPGGQPLRQTSRAREGLLRLGSAVFPNLPPSPNPTRDGRKRAQTTEGPGPWPCADSHYRVLGPKGHQGCAPRQPAVCGQGGHLAAEPRERLPISGDQQKPSMRRPAPCHEPTGMPTAHPAELLTWRGPSTPPPCRTCLRPGSPQSHLGEKRSRA